MNIKNRLLKKYQSKDLHARDLFQGSSYAFVFKIFAILVNYIFTYLVTKSYGAEINGLFNLGFVVLTITTVIARLGLDTAMLRFTTEYWISDQKGALKATYLEMLRLVVPACIAANMILYFGAEYMANTFFSKPELATYIRVFSFMVLPYSLMMIHSECLRAVKLLKYYLFYEGIAVYFFNSILLFVFFFFKRDEEVLIYSCLFTIFLFGIHSTYIWLRKGQILSTKFTKGRSMKEILKTSLPMLTSNSLMNLMTWVDTILLGVFRSAVEVGVYAIAIKIALITKVTLTAINSFTAPRFAEYYSKKDMVSFAKTSQYSTKLIFWTSAPVMVFIFIFPQFCMGFFGEEFKIGATALIILTIGQFIASISGSVGYILNLTDNQVLQQNITLFTIIVNVVLNIILIPVYGIIGAAIASATGLILRNLISVYFIKRKFDFLTIYFPFLTKGKKHDIT